MDGCVYCKSPARLQCQRCREFYCSLECQAYDWPNHKFICVTMPALVTTTNKQFSKKGASANVSIDGEKRSARQYPDSSLTPMRLPYNDNKNSMEVLNLMLNLTSDQNLLVEEKSQKEGLGINHDCIKSEPNISDTPLKNQLSKSSESNDELESNLKNEKCTKALDKKVAEITLRNKSSTSSIEINNGNSDRSRKVYKTLKSFQNGFFNAVVQYTDDKSKLVWVSDEAWIEDINKLLSETNRQTNRNEEASERDVCYGALIVAPFESILYRAIVIEEVNPFDEVRVRLLDYGNDFHIAYRQCMKASSIIKNLPAMAFPIKYSKNVEVGEQICIRILNEEDNNVFSVEEMNDKSANSGSIENFDISKKSIMSSLGERFAIKIFHRLNINKKKCFGIIQQDNENELSQLNKILNDSGKKYYDILEETITTGSYVAAQFNKAEWRRGLILGNYKTDYLVLFIDDGKIKIVKNIKRLPADFKSIANPLVSVEFSEIENKKAYLTHTQDLRNSTCNVLEFSSDYKMLKCRIFNAEAELGTALLTVFDGNYKNFIGSDSYVYPFTSGDNVCINEVINYSTVVLSLVDLISYYENIFNAIGEFSKPLEHETPLKEKEIILFKTNEMTKYIRGGVNSVIDSLHYEVMHLESGNIFKVKSDCIKQATDFVRFCPIVVRKVSLFILSVLQTQHEFNKATETLLKKLCNDKQVFIFQWEKNSAELFFDERNTLSLNKQITSELYECAETVYDFDTKNPEPDKTSVVIKKISKNLAETSSSSISHSTEKIFKLNDVEVIPLKTGENIRLIILDTSELAKGVFTASVDDLEYYKKLVNISPSITKYCLRDDIEKEYCPKVGELCLTYFEVDEQWYRAFCINVELNDQFSLMFLDYGNIQLSKSAQIRRMTEEFLFPSYANSCMLLDFPEQLSESSLKKFNELIHPDSRIEVDKVEKIQDQEYFITIRGIEKI